MKDLQRLYDALIDDGTCDERTPELKMAYEKIVDYFGENFIGDIEDIIDEYAYYSQQNGFIAGFCYAAFAFGSGKAVSA